jgi:hypothetical protein
MEQPVSSDHTFASETETQTTCRSHDNMFCQINPDSRSLHDGSLSHQREHAFATLAQ